MNREPISEHSRVATARLHVFYDAHCEFCRHCRAWLEKQPAYLKIAFVPYQAPHATVLFPQLAEFHPEKEIVVIANAGGATASGVTQVYTGAGAWVMCLYATREYRELSLRLAHPALMPLARKVCHLVSQNRYNISALFRKHPEETARELDAFPADPNRCHSGACAAPKPPPLPKMKVALIDRTGLKELPLVASLYRRGHHIVVVSTKENPPIAPGSAAARFEYHRIGLDDVAQLVTAFQHCAVAVICTGDSPATREYAGVAASEERTILEACRRARVSQLTHLRFTHARTNGAPHDTRSAETESSHAA